MWHIRQVGRAAHMHHGAGGVAPLAVAASAPMAALAVARHMVAAALQGS